MLVVRGYLREKVADVEAHQLGGRDCVNMLETVLHLARSKVAKQATKLYELRWLDTLPLKELAETKNAVLKNFSEKRIPAWQSR